MRKIHALGLALVAMLALGAVAATSAFAENTWLVSGAAVTGAVSVDSEGTLVLEDMGTGVKIECSGTDEGTVETEGKDTETTVTENLASCVVLAGLTTCKKILAVKAIDLPWNTQINGLRDHITNSGAGNPGWLVECEGPLGIKVDDACTLAGGSTLLQNKESGVLESIFEEASGEANCSVGGEKVGLVTGTVLILTLDGLALAFS